VLHNELNLISILMKGPQSELITFHQYSKGSGTGNSKFSKTTACRCIKVVRDEAGRMNFKYDKHTPDEPLVFSSAQSLIYRSCPSSTTGEEHYYFGDIFLGVKKSREDFLDSIWPFNYKEYPLVTEFNQVLKTKFSELWDYVEEVKAQVLADPAAEGLKDVKKYSGLFIHFDFTELMGVKHWYELDGIVSFLDYLEIEGLKSEGKEKATFEFIPNIRGYSVNKGFFHTVTSGDDKSDNQFPGFDLTQKYKSFYLEENQLRCAFYYSKVLKACQIGIPMSAPYCFRLIPVGDYDTQVALDFIDQIKSIRGGVTEDSVNVVDTAEMQIVSEDENTSDWDPIELLSRVNEKCAKDIISFDIILLRRGGVTTPDMNVGELNNMSRSSLRKNLHLIKDKVTLIREKRKARTSVSFAFYDLHKNIKKGEKYQIKCARMMLKLYRGLYFGDPELDKIFIERVHKDIRDSGMKNYYGLKTSYDLLKLLSNKEEEMTESQKESKKLGQCLAQIMWPLSFVIGRRSRSFEKAQVGQIRYRVGSLPQVIRLLGEYRARIAMHAGESLGENTRQIVSTIQVGEALRDANLCVETIEKEGLKYDRDQLVLGFFNEYDNKCSSVKQ
jgi:hypothetical protein